MQFNQHLNGFNKTKMTKELIKSQLNFKHDNIYCVLPNYDPKDKSNNPNNNIFVIYFIIHSLPNHLGAFYICSLRFTNNFPASKLVFNVLTRSQFGNNFTYYIPRINYPDPKFHPTLYTILDNFVKYFSSVSCSHIDDIIASANEYNRVYLNEYIKLFMDE